MMVSEPDHPHPAVGGNKRGVLGTVRSGNFLWAEDDFDERHKRLLASLSDLAVLLSTFGENAWAEWIRRDREKIERGQRHGLDSLLSAFGGMGSLNDVVVHPLNGHPIDDEQIDSVNVDLDRLRGDVHSDASALRRQLDHP